MTDPDHCPACAGRTDIAYCDICGRARVIPDPVTLLLAAAAQTSGATSDMIETARDGHISPHDYVGAGDTLTILADGLRLLIEAMDPGDGAEDVTQLHCAVIRFLEDRA